MTITRKKRPALLGVAAAASLAIVLAGCSANASSGGDAGASGGGGELAFAIGNDPLNLNPTAAASNGNDTWYVTRQVYESLVYQNPETQAIEPWLAEEFEVNDDATEFTFILRDDVTFSDGTPLTATTVKLNLDDAKAAGAESAAAGPLANYVETEVVDERTAVVRFSAPNAAFLSRASAVTLGLISDESIEVPFADRAQGTNISGSGPFVIESYAKDQATVLKKREDYAWAPAAFGNDGAAKIDGVEFAIVPEASNRTGGLTSGQVDVAGGIAPNDIAAVEAAAGIVVRANPGTVFGVYFNEKNPVIADAAVREAVALTVDAAEIRDGALSEHFAVATSPLSQTTQYYEDVSSVIPKPAPDAAAALLESAGWTLGSDGVREKDGQRLTFRINYINNFGPNSDSIALLQQQLSAVGIASERISGTVPEFQSVLESGEYEIAWRNISGVDPDTLRTDFSDQGVFNWPVGDAALNAALIEQVTLGDSDERAERVKELQRALVEGFHFVPVHELTTVVGVSDRASGIELGADSRLNLLINAEKVG